MKKIYLPLALATTLALGACSSDNVVDNGGSNPIDLSKGGFVKMSLNLPTDNNRGSRAELNDTLKDGLANEYGIKNAYLVLFEGATMKMQPRSKVPTNSRTAILEILRRWATTPTT